MILVGFGLFLYLKLDWYWFFIFFIIAVLIPEYLFRNVQQNKKRKGKALKSEKQENTKITKTNKTKTFKTEEEIIATYYMELDGYEFERLVELYFKDIGYIVESTPPRKDGGIDIIRKDPKDNFITGIQCKHWQSKKVGDHEIQTTIGGARIHKCHKAMVITTGKYTEEARKRARDNNVDIWDGNDVKKKIGKWQEKKH